MCWANSKNPPTARKSKRAFTSFVEWVRSGKLEIKAHPAENLHAKLYIMTFAEEDRDKGRVITGSSNLTQSGLQDNLEFNVELKNRADYDFAIAKFNELWAMAVDVSKPYEDAMSAISCYSPAILKNPSAGKSSRILTPGPFSPKTNTASSSPPRCSPKALTSTAPTSSSTMTSRGIRHASFNASGASTA